MTISVHVPPGHYTYCVLLTKLGMLKLDVHLHYISFTFKSDNLFVFHYFFIFFPRDEGPFKLTVIQLAYKDCSYGPRFGRNRVLMGLKRH